MLTPLSKIILISIASLAVATLLVRLFLRSRRKRPAGPKRPGLFARIAGLFRRSPETRPPAEKPIPLKSKSSTPKPATDAPKASGSAVPAEPPATSIHSDAEVQRPAPVTPASSTLPKLEPADVPIADTSDYAFGPVTPVLAQMLPESDERRAQLKTSLVNAGYYTPHAWHNLAAVRYLGLMLPILLFGTLLVMVPPVLEPLMIGGLVTFPILGWALPSLYVRSRAAERLREIERAMPDMLDLLNMCVSQGMTVPNALSRVSRELRPVYPALAKELQIVTEQARLMNLEEALDRFSARVDVPEVHSFTSLITQTERMGTSVSEALIEYSDNMRETMRQRTDEKANAATFKLLFPTVFCLMPAVYLFLLGPAIIELSDFFNSGAQEVLNASDQAALLTPEE
ncbi:Bacterial type II secretion system protein F domain protein [Maioricimonas rarisocia]|uniref:Bacterial type II secretion system protein F domain protein n=1 Tax=Maioricimonas rarisocia TaxID=2528026 RepID=A0A517ZFX2_9PLAN|nr:type II secretion system F family protein [Maioricimonas rarisocia]QDU41339.1 Bacterial type II secretion system protein F domain protein [Maioricimonas rarisocia]